MGGDCLQCPFMACKVFTVKTEKWTGFCMNKASPKYHTKVTGADGCAIVKELDIFSEP